MNKKILGLSFVALCGVVSIGAAIGIYNNYSGVEKIVAEDKTDTDYKRIYAILNDSYWYNDSTSENLYIYHNSSTDSVSFDYALQMTLIGNSYSGSGDNFRYGLYYADIPADATSITFKMYDGPYTDANLWLQTDDYGLSTESEYQALYISNVASGKRPVYPGTAHLGSDDLATLLKIFDTCSTSILDGYNAYAQINAIFLNGNSNYDRNTEVYEDGGVTYTIGDIIDAMKARYDAQDRYA